MTQFCLTNSNNPVSSTCENDTTFHHSLSISFILFVNTLHFFLFLLCFLHNQVSIKLVLMLHKTIRLPLKVALQILYSDSNYLCLKNHIPHLRQCIQKNRSHHTTTDNLSHSHCHHIKWNRQVAPAKLHHKSICIA